MMERRDVGWRQAGHGARALRTRALGNCTALSPATNSEVVSYLRMLYSSSL